MKQNRIIFRICAVLLGIVVIFASCTEDNSDPMAENIADYNSYVTALDKVIASPGDEVVVTGSNLDKVFKIMLNDNVALVPFQATSTSLTFTIPSGAPLGDVVIVNFFFSGKGLAQRSLEIMSPPRIVGFSPIASVGGEELRVMGVELYKATQVFVGATEVEFELIDDKNIIIHTLPTITDGDLVRMVDASGAEIESPSGIIRGTELLITDFDSDAGYFTSLSSNGNMDGDREEVGELPYGIYYTFDFVDNNTSWGGNLDFYFDGAQIPESYNDNTKVYLYMDIKVSDAISGRIMVEGPNVYGDDFQFNTEWTTHKFKLSDLYTGYGNGAEQGAAPIMSGLKGVKVQPPAGADSGNFGKTISVDNIKFVVVE